VKDRISGFFILKAIYLPPTSGRRLILRKFDLISAAIWQVSDKTLMDKK